MNRSLHRWIALPIAIFLLWIGATGVILQIDKLSHRGEHHRDGAAARDEAGPPPDAQVGAAVAQALAAARRTDPALAVRVVTVNLSGPLTVSVANRPRGGTHVDYDAATGTAREVTEQPSFDSFIMDLHSGAAIGKAGNALGLIAGAALVGLAISGFILWFQLWRRRAQAGRRGLFWRR